MEHRNEGTKEEEKRDDWKIWSHRVSSIVLIGRIADVRTVEACATDDHFIVFSSYTTVPRLRCYCTVHRSQPDSGSLVTNENWRRSITCTGGVVVSEIERFVSMPSCCASVVPVMSVEELPSISLPCRTAVLVLPLERELCDVRSGYPTLLKILPLSWKEVRE